ncbi:DUF397 domain-containing protein [Streptomyces justiciae]|uniref:DUF397 domain-containing protein n=1 Tax=Streptomyces justiciae TaxID=2780140 RepID=UPI0018817465|nr:DUF397 domain-containing protein [Streptomyces justiciae]MBE8477819.1 DUF397 domain-containing protein [Streptomyces justiciae]
MLTPDTWTKASYSGGGQGDACVEVTDRHTHIAIRDSKDPTQGTLSFLPATFTTFIDAVNDGSKVGLRSRP